MESKFLLTTNAWDDAEAGLREAHGRSGRHRPQVRPERQLSAAPERHAIQRGNDRHRERGQSGNDAAHRVAEADDFRGRLPGALLQVRARAEGACSGPRTHGPPS